jgi:hypothetical protein
MKNKLITISSTGLTAGTATLYNCEIVESSTGATDIGARPQGFYFKNNSGVTIEVNFITRQELKEYLASDTNFRGIAIGSGDTFNHRDILGVDKIDPPPSFLVVKGLGGTASSGLNIYCLNYV